MLIRIKYIPNYSLNKNDDVGRFLEVYLSRGERESKLELDEVPVGNNLYEYYIYNQKFDRKLYLATLKLGDKEGLKHALIEKEIWI